MPYLLRRQVTFCSFDFLLARMYRWFCGFFCGLWGEKKKDRWHWSTEEINRVTSLHSWGLVEGFLLLKTVSSERWQTHHSMKSELRLCSMNLLGCFPLPWLFGMWRLMGKHYFDVLLNFLWNILDMRCIRYKFKASGLNSQLVLMIFCTAPGDILSRLFNVLIGI